MDGKSAIRSNMMTRIDEEMAEEPVLEPEQEAIAAEERLNEVYASLASNPGWKLIKAEFEETIAAYRSGRVLKEAVAKLTLEELGRKTVTCNAVADELEKIILTVETAVAQVEEKKARGRAKRSL